jgi:hypothetical protein
MVRKPLNYIVTYRVNSPRRRWRVQQVLTVAQWQGIDRNGFYTFELRPLFYLVRPYLPCNAGRGDYQHWDFGEEVLESRYRGGGFAQAAVRPNVAPGSGDNKVSDKFLVFAQF